MLTAPEGFFGAVFWSDFLLLPVLRKCHRNPCRMGTDMGFRTTWPKDKSAQENSAHKKSQPKTTRPKSPNFRRQPGFALPIAIVAICAEK